MFIELLEKFLSLKRINFYVFTFLWIINALMILPFSPVKSILTEYQLGNTAVALWLNRHQTIMMHTTAIFCLLFIIVTALSIITYKCENIEKYTQLDILSEEMMVVGHYYIMIVEILYRLNLTEFGAVQSMGYLLEMTTQNNLLFSLSVLGYSTITATLLLSILDYFTNIRNHLRSGG